MILEVDLSVTSEEETPLSDRAGGRGVVTAADGPRDFRYVFRAEQIGCYSDSGYLEIEDDEE